MRELPAVIALLFSRVLAIGCGLLGTPPQTPHLLILIPKHQMVEQLPEAAASL